MLRIPNTGLIIAFVMIATLLVVNATVTYKNTIRLHDQADRVQHAHEVIEAIYAVRSAIKDAETGQRGFLITGREAYLDPYKDGLAKIEHCLDELTRLVADDPEQAARIPALTVSIRARMRELAHALEVRRGSGLDAAREVENSDVGKREMDAIRVVFTTMHADEVATLRERSAERESMFEAAVRSAVITTLGSILLFSAAALLIRRNIIMRTRATDALVEQGDLLRTTLASIIEGIFVTDSEGRITYVNPVAEHMCGRSLVEAVGQPIESVLDMRDPTTDLPAPNTAITAIRRACVGIGSKGRVLITPDGTRLGVEDVAAPLLGAGGKLVGCVLSVRDVTDQRRDEARIGDARAYAESIVDTVADPLVILDHDGRVRSANVAFFELFRCSETKIVEQSLFGLEGVRWNASAVRGVLEQAVASRAGEDMLEIDCVLPDESKHILSLNARRLRGEGEHSNLVLLAIRDVTARRDNERRVTQLLDSAQENASRLREIASASLALNSAHSRERVIEVLRDEARRILECESVTVTFETAKPAGKADEPVAALLGRDGRMLGWVRLHGTSPLSGTSRENDEAMLRQLVNIASVAIENARLYEELRDGDRRKDEFLATLAHELRNPLAPISNSVQILRAPESGARMHDQAVATLERQVSLLVRLVDDLLDVSRITRGKIVLKIELVDLAEIVGRALEISRPIVDASGHKLSVALPGQRTLLRVDASRIAQALANLLNNAAKYTDRGGNVKLSCAVEDDEVAISVRDDGMGIPPEVLPHIFTMFWQVGHALERAQGGLGIGLTLVKQLVDLHGGRVEARSAGIGRGSEFIVRLPLAEAPSAAPVPVQSNGATQARPSSARRILVVDDNVDSAQSLAILLRLQGHDVHTAHDGAEALTAFDMFRPELVLLDIGLPRIDGHEAGRILRAQHGRTFLLVAMTGFGRTEDRARSRDAGFDHHLVKPIDPARLTAILCELDTTRG